MRRKPFLLATSVLFLTALVCLVTPISDLLFGQSEAASGSAKVQSRKGSAPASQSKAKTNPQQRGTSKKAVRIREEKGLLNEMSAMGHLARLARSGELDLMIGKARARAQSAKGLPLPPIDVVRNGCDPLREDCGEDDADSEDGPAGGQAELSVSVDSTGLHVVIGFNDTRGFALNPVSLSGFLYSDDGGVTFIDGGQLPVNTGTFTLPNGTILPQVFGDPEIKYLGGPNFIYFSIEVARFLATNNSVQTLCVHRSTDFGHTWQGPFEIPPATNPNGLTLNGAPRDAADKEFADVDPDTGRVMMSWSNFTLTSIAPGGVEITTTFSDNILTATPPTWSPRVTVGKTIADGQASLPRFAGNGSPNVYVTWRRFPSFDAQNVGFARSTDNGVTFAPTINLATDFFTMDSVLGNDRINTSPATAVDNSTGPNKGNVYVVYANNNNGDGSDIAFQRSTDQGVTFSAPIIINSRLGNDRAQWFPWVTVDNSSGRIYAFYYDQGISTDSDLTETTYVFSDTGGILWSKPMPLTDRPFHAGYGNDTGQPNIGDYNQAVAQNGQLFAVWAGTTPVGFTDGEPTSTSFTVPDVFFKKVAATSNKASLIIGPVTFTDTGSTILGGNGSIDPGETIRLKMPLTNYVTNSISAGMVTGIIGRVTTTTPGVTVTTGTSAYPTIVPAATIANNTDFVLQIASTFVVGTPIELSLAVTTLQGSTTLLFTRTTGTPNPKSIFSENFDGVNPGQLPAGWAVSHGTGNNIINWTTNNTFNPGNNGAFHTNANDGLSGNSTRFERLFSPIFAVPATAEYVTLDFDVMYNTEDSLLEEGFNIKLFDGFNLRITDQTAGRILRSVQLEAFAEEFTTGNSNFYPKAFVRNSALSLSTLPAWGGNSQGLKHVRLKLPGMAGSTIQLRFEYQQDSIATCIDAGFAGPCGVLFDNVVMRAVNSISPTTTTVTSSLNPSTFGSPVTFTATVRNLNNTAPTDGTVTFLEGNVTLSGPTTIDVNGQAAFTTSTLGVGPHTITAQYTSTSGNFTASTGNVTQTVNCATITLSPPTLPNGAAGTPYSQTITASGGLTPYTFAISAGSLPTGLTLSSAGVISGTPTALGTFSFTIRATDVFNCMGTQAYSVMIVCPTLTVSSSVAYAALTAPQATSSGLYTVNLSTGAATLVGTIGGGATVRAVNVDPTSGSILALTTVGNKIVTVSRSSPSTVLASVLVTGLQSGETLLGITFRPLNGMLYGLGSTSRLYTINQSSGIATQVGTGQFATLLSGTEFGFDFNPVPDRIRVVSNTSQDLRLNPDTGAIAAVDPNLNGAATTAVGASYTNSFAGTLTTTLYDIDALSDSLYIQNPPNNGTLVLVGALNFDTSDLVGFDISNPLVLPNAQVGAAYSIKLNGVGGIAPYSFTTNSTLPGTFSLAPDGTLSGTSTVTGTFPIMVSVTDTNGCTGTQTYNLTVNCATISLSTSTAFAALTAPAAASSGFYQVNLSTGKATLVGMIGGGATVRGTSFQLNTDTVFAVTSNNTLVSFNRNSPNAVTTVGAISGATGNIVGIDFRPATGQLFGVSSASQVYIINTTTAAATQVGTGSFTPALSGTAFGVNFNPVPDRIRVVSNTGQDLRLNPDTGGVAATDPNLNGAATTAVGAAYTNNFAGSLATTLYDIDALSDSLYMQNPPNNGTLVLVGPLGFNTNDSVGFDISNSMLPNGSIGVLYSQTILGVGGTGPYTFIVTGTGTLPNGLSLSAGGALTGTPTTSGSFTFSVMATDANGCSGSQSYTVSVDCATITLSPSTLPNGALGIPYSQTITANPAGIYTFTVTSGSLPNGLSLDSSSGVVSGMPTLAGNFSFTITAKDANGCAGSLPYALSISCAAISLSPDTLPNGTVGVAYSQTISASGGAGPYMFDVSSGTLPTGLTLNATTGVLSGTVNTATTATFRIRATDANGCTGSQSYSLSIVLQCPTITVSPSTIPNGTAGVAYSQTFTASGGTGPYTFSVISGALPTGLTLSSAGLLSGTPSAGVFSFTILARDALSCPSSSMGYAITIVPALAPTITTFTPATGPAGTQVTITGLNFTTATAVKFGAAVAQFTFVSNSQIMTTVPATANTAAISVTTSKGTVTTGTKLFTVIKTSTVSTFTPALGAVGTTVIISGTNLGTATEVKFNGVSAGAPTIVSATSIRAIVPMGTTTGKISVTNPAGDASGTGIFKVTPKVNSLTPASGIAGENFSISGLNLKVGGTNPTVKIGAVIAPITSSTDTQVVVTIPATAVTGKIMVTTVDGSGLSTTDFTVIKPPTVTTFTPAMGVVGATVTLSGANLSSATDVTFNGATVGTITPISATSIKVTVPPGATMGKISVTNRAGTASSAGVFKVLPTLSILTPSSSLPGETVKITGLNLTGATMVRFGAVTVSTSDFTVDSDTQITAKVPATATTGKVAVMTPSGMGLSSTDFIVIRQPAVTSFTPGSGKVGSIVTVMGTNLSSVTEVMFGNQSAGLPTVVSGNSIKITVPQGATTGKMTVVNRAGQATSPGTFTVTQ